MLVIISDHLKLGLLSMDDLDPFFQAIHKNMITKDDYRIGLQNKFHTKEKLSTHFLDIIENKYSLDKTPDFFIYDNDVIAGVFQFHPLTSDDHVEIGYWLFEEYRNQKILTNIFPVMIEYARNHFDKAKILATTGIDNIPSKHLLQKFLFKKTGKVIEQKTSKGIELEYEYVYNLRD